MHKGHNKLEGESEGENEVEEEEEKEKVEGLEVEGDEVRFFRRS